MVEVSFAPNQPLVPQAPVTLAFDPEGLTDPVLVGVFQNRVARNLWIGIKWRHIVSQYFDEDCLRIAGRLKAQPVKTAYELAKVFSHGRDPVFRGVNPGHELAEALFPYVCGEQDFAYVVKLDG